MDLKRDTLSPALNYCVVYCLQVSEGKKCIQLKVKFMALLLKPTSEMTVNMVAFNDKKLQWLMKKGNKCLFLNIKSSIVFLKYLELNSMIVLFLLYWYI